MIVVPQCFRCLLVVYLINYIVMKNFDKFFSELKRHYGQVSSSELNNCAVRVNSIPLFENVIDSTGHLMSDLELGTRTSSDPEIQALINSGFYAARSATHNENWDAPVGVRHLSLAQLFDTLQYEEPAAEPAVASSSEPASSSSAEPSKD